MDNQNVLVIGGAVVGMFVIGGFVLSGPDRSNQARTYAVDDIRYKFQQEDLKNKKKNKKTAVQTPVYSTGTSSNASSLSETSEHEEPSVFDREPQEEPPLD